MSSQISLQTLIRRVPVCLQGITLDALWLVLAEGNHDCVVVVNPQHHPIGLVYLRRLTPYISSPRRRQSGPDKRNLADLGDRLIEPLLLVPAHLSWKEFWAYLREIGRDLGWDPIAPFSEDEASQNLSPIALIDGAGEFLGLIDLLKLLQAAVMKPPGTPDRRKSAPRMPEADTLQGFPFLTSLLQLLEPLPLPMMIQTEGGQVLGQNIAWRSQVGDEPEAIRDAAQAVAQWCARDTGPASGGGEIARSGGSASPGSDPFDPEPQRAGSTLLQTATPPDSEPAPSPRPSPMPSWCHLSSSPDTYVCICPTPGTRERVWQFARQPLVRPTNPETPSGLWLILAQDITEQHRVAQELAAKNADLIQLNRLKDEFLACISHELKTPLTAVLGLSSLLKDRSLGELSDRQARYAQLIHQSGRHLMMVVNDILDLTRIETGQLELVPEGADIRATCDRAFETARQLQRQDGAGDGGEPETQHRFTLEIEPDLETIEADELRLRQMLVNLISNAFKFTPPGGALGLRVGRWEDWIAFTVWDTGIGIPEDKQHLIFEKFQQLESPLTRKFEGTGLGLVLTQRLARLHGGDVSFISKQGEGSQFTLLLPPAPPPQRWKSDRLDWEQSPSPRREDRESKAASTRPTPQVQSRLVLLVEAVPRFIQVLSDQLGSLGYRAIVARTGTEAVEKARRLQPRVIFLNPLLPLLSGWDVLTLLKTDAETRQIPVFITATLGDKKRAVRGCCDGFLSLPVQKADLQQAFAQLERCPPPEPAKRLTVLWLNPATEGYRPPPAEGGTFPKPSRVCGNLQLPAGLPHRQRHPQISHCRILEADDLNQAELLARIWHPDAIVLENTDGVEDPAAFLRLFGKQENLANIPLVTLDSATTQAANQIAALSVFPCLASQTGDRAAAESGSSQLANSALLQVIQVAAGMSWKPNILVVDLGTLPDFAESDGARVAAEAGPAENDGRHSPEDPTSKIERALIQYLQTAGFRGSMGRSWEEILQQLQCLSVDLLLICVRDPASPLLMRALSTLLRVASPEENPRVTLPPMLILDHSSLTLSAGRGPTAARPAPDLPADLKALMDRMGVELLSGQISMAELLDRIRDRI